MSRRESLTPAEWRKVRQHRTRRAVQRYLHAARARQLLSRAAAGDVVSFAGLPCVVLTYAPEAALLTAQSPSARVH